MKTKKIPMRQCTGCGMQKEKKELIRIVKTPEGKFLLDDTGRKNGRGAYICKSVDCLCIARKKKSFNRSFQMEVPQEVYDALEKEMRELGSE